MLRHLQRRSIRQYHKFAHSGRGNARQANEQKLPVVRFPNLRLQRFKDLKKHHEAPVRVDPTATNRMFEPFPYKVNEENRVELMKRKVTPLFDVPYKEQLESKETFCKNVFRHFSRELYQSGTPVRLDVRKLPCHINQIVGCPALNNYRNKDEFCIWRGFDGKIVAGHMLFPLGVHGDTVTVEPNGCEVIKSETIAVNNLFNEFLQTQAKFPVSYDLGLDGGWRRLLVRVNVEGELMVVGFINPRTLKVRQVLEERDNFKEFMVRRCQETGLRLASLYYQPTPNSTSTHREIPYELLHGSPTITERIGDFTIRISPETFVHNSTAGAEMLYGTARKMLKECFLDENQTERLPVVVNAQAGAGLLSLNLADLVHQVVGVDRNPVSVDDATASAADNGVANVEFVNSDLEVVLGRIVDRHARKRRELIFVCDVPNLGLPRNTVDLLKNNRDIRKVMILMSINSRTERSTVMNNLVGLCSKGGHRSMPPFAPILVTPVDTCPHIETFQAVVALERPPA